MLIQGSPDMLAPPRTPTFAGLDAWSDLIEADMQAFVDIYAGRAPWAGLKVFQRVQLIRTYMEQYSITIDEAAKALGLTAAALQSWLYDGDAYWSKPLGHLLDASWLDAPRIGAALRDFARSQNLAVDDLARITGKTLDAINRLLSVATPASVQSVNVIAQATPTSAGLVAFAGTDLWAVIPAGSDPVEGAQYGYANGDALLQVFTTSGYQVNLPQGPERLQIPINSRGVGAVQSIMGNQNLTLADKARAIAAVQAEFGASDAEMQYLGADVGGLTYAQFIAAGTATYAAYSADQIAFGPRSITNNEDAELWDLFSSIWNSTDTLDQRIAGMVDAMLANDVGLYDLSRITGFDAVAWQQVLGIDADFAQARTVPVVVAPQLVDATYTVQQIATTDVVSPAAAAAQSSGGIGITAMHQNIRNFIAQAGNDYRKVVDAMQTWGVSLTDIRAALYDVAGSAVWISGLENYINAPPVTAAAPSPPVVKVAAQTNAPVTVSTPGAPTVIQVPDNLSAMTAAQKVAWYRATLAAGHSDAAIRSAVEAKYGPQTDANWGYLRSQAGAGAAGGAGAGAGLLIAAAAAYFLLG